MTRLGRAVAAHGLPGTRTRLPTEPLDPQEWLDLLAVVRNQRLTGLLDAAITDGTLAATPEQAGEAAEAQFGEMCHALVLERKLLSLQEMLAHRGIEIRVLKGSAVAHLDYPDPALRPFGDIDLLIGQERLDAAVDLLAATGHRRRFPEPRPGFDRRFVKAVSFLSNESLEIDVHRTLTTGPFGLTVDLADAWSEAEGFDLGGRRLLALGSEGRFLHGCLHAVLGDNPPRLLALRDVAQMATADRLELTSVIARAASWDADSVVARAITLAWDAFGLPSSDPVACWARSHRPNARQRLLLAICLDPRATYATKTLASVLSVPGVRPKGAFLWALAFPERGYLEGRHSSRMSRWRAAARQVVHQGPG